MTVPEPPRLAKTASSAWSGEGKRARHVPGLWAGIAMLVVWVALTSSGFWSGASFDGPVANEPRLAFPPQILASVVLGLAIAVFGWAGFGMVSPRAGWVRLMWLPGLYLAGFAGFLISNGTLPIGIILALLFSMFWVAVSEELMFRGILFPAMRSALRFWPAVFLSSAIFGMVHLMNAIGHGDVMRAAFQSFNAFMIGLLFVALRLRSGSIWPPILLHWLWNVGVYAIDMSIYGFERVEPGRDVGNAITASESGDAILLSLMLSAGIAPHALYALWLMRRRRWDDMPGDIRADAPEVPEAPPPIIEEANAVQQSETTPD